MAGEREALMSSVPHVSSSHVLCISNSHVSAGGHEVWSHPSTVRKGMGRRRMDTLTRRGRHRATIIAINSRDERYPQIRI